MNDDQGPGWRCQRSISATGSSVHQRPSGARRGRNAVKAKMLLQLLEAVCTPCIGLVLKLPCFVRGIFLCHELLSAGAVPVACLANALEPLIRLDGRKAFDPAAQIGREHECAPSAFLGRQCAGTNCLIESGPTGTRVAGAVAGAIPADGGEVTHVGDAFRRVALYNAPQERPRSISCGVSD